MVESLAHKPASVEGQNHRPLTEDEKKWLTLGLFRKQERDGTGLNREQVIRRSELWEDLGLVGLDSKAISKKTKRKVRKIFKKTGIRIHEVGKFIPRDPEKKPLLLHVHGK